MKKNKILKFSVMGLLLAGLVVFYFSGGAEYFSLSFLQTKLGNFKHQFEENPLKVGLIFFGTYVLVTALSFPGAAVMTLLAGALFGPLLGLGIVSIASTLGSLLAFLTSRFVLRDFLLKKFRKQFQTIDINIEKDGAFYLATLRLVPVFPFFIVNLVMGLTKIPALTFTWVSMLGMLPGTAVFVFAGRQFSQLESLKGIMSPGMIGAFALLGLLPIVGKWSMNTVKKRKAYKGFKKPKKFDYNLVAIGAGSAGLVTAYIGAAVKAKVALIEKTRMGGDCLNTGCVPSKALIKSAKVAHLRHHAHTFGFSEIRINFKFSDVMDRVKRVIQEVAPHDSVERYESLGVECIEGKATILDPWTIEVNGKKITTKNMVVATGAGPSVPPIEGLGRIPYVTSETLWDIRELPKKFLVVGCGPIGVEIAQAFARFGSEVTIVEAGERILSKEDPEVSTLLEKVLTGEGIKILTRHKVRGFTETFAICEHEGKEVHLDCDLVLLALGRSANTRGFGLQELGVKLRKNGTIETDEYLQTNLPNIFACGDVTGPYQLTHMAAHQAWYCAVNGLFPHKFKVDYGVVPWCTYTDPEVATVGETETSAREKEIEFEITTFEMADLDRAITEDERQGLVRVITEKGKDKILGATIVSSQASSMITEFVTTMKYKKGLNSILGTIHVYPSFSEANKYAAGNWKKAHVNPRTLKLLSTFFSWRRG